MKKIILLILGMQIGFTCFAGQLITIALDVQKDKDPCNTVVWVKGNKNTITSSHSLVPNNHFSSILCTLAHQLSINPDSRNHDAKTLLSKLNLTSVDKRALLEKVELSTLLENIKEANAKNIAIESFKSSEFNKNDEPAISFILALSQSNIITHHKFEFYTKECLHKDTLNCYHTSYILITKQPSIILTPWWQPTLKWGAVTLIGCGGLAAGYLAYHKWLKK